MSSSDSSRTLLSLPTITQNNDGNRNEATSSSHLFIQESEVEFWNIN